MTNKIEELGSKVVGTAKAVVATVEGYTGVWRRLVQEHGEVAALLARLRVSSSPDVRREVFPTIRKVLLAHEEAELREVYPVLLSHGETRAFAQEHLAGADELKRQIDQVNAIAVDSPTWGEAFERLVELVHAHVELEEERYFPAAQRAFGARSDEMLARYDVIHAQAMRDLNRTP